MRFEITLVAALIATSATVSADPMPQRSTLETCLHAALQIQAGEFVKLEYLDPSAEGVPAYEIEVRNAAGREWEFMCNADTGAIFEIEQEADSADDPLFKKHAKVDLKAAKDAVLALYPGTIEEVEYEIEANGDASYEIDVVDANGTEFKVEVDAASGDIIEVSVEQWEIGEEPDEKP